MKTSADDEEYNIINTNEYKYSDDNPEGNCQSGEISAQRSGHCQYDGGPSQIDEPPHTLAEFAAEEYLLLDKFFGQIHGLFTQLSVYQWTLTSTLSEMADGGSDYASRRSLQAKTEDRRIFETSDIVHLRRGFQKCEHADMDHKMPFINGYSLAQPQS